MSYSTPPQSYQSAQPPPTPPSDGAAEVRPKRRRGLYWTALVLTFLLWALASCGGAAALVGLDQITLSDLQGGEPMWSPPEQPPATPQPVVADGDSASGEEVAPGAAPSVRFAQGSTLRNATSSRVNVRRSPGYLSKSDDDVVAQLQPGELLTVTGPSLAADSLVWWPVQVQPAGGGVMEGWVAEATASGVQILAPVQ